MPAKPIAINDLDTIELTGIDLAIEALSTPEIPGTEQMLADRITEHLPKGESITQQAVSRWVQNEVVPWRWCRIVEHITGVPRAKLNPFVYGDHSPQ